MIKKIVILLMLILSTITLSNDEYIKGKVISVEKVEVFNQEYADEIVKEVQIIKVKILQGKEKGLEVLVDHALFNEEASNVVVSPNDTVVVLREAGDSPVYYIVDKNKTGWLWGIFGIFITLTLLIAKDRGIKAILALGITGLAIMKFLVPLIIGGHSPIFYSTIVAIFSCIVTITLMTGATAKGTSAFLGSIIGVLTAGILSYFFTNAMGLTGFSTNEIVTMSDMLKQINLKELISAGIILGSMGAVMDVGMSIASSLNELKTRDINITSKELFVSGINIGSDIIGTMVNTLILAYAGSSLITMLLIIMQGADYPLIRILNFEFISIEIMRALCGSIGILITVPATAYISSILYVKKQK